MAPDPGPAIRSSGPGTARLAAVLEGATAAQAACTAVAEHLYRPRRHMPSVYLERHGELRCLAQRGLWQIPDGFGGPSGLTGAAWGSGSAILVPDVTTDPRCRPAIPGVVSELCVPIVVRDACRGVLNVASAVALPASVVRDVEACAAMLGRRLDTLGDDDGSAWDRLAGFTVAVSRIAADASAPSLLLRALLDASGFDSAAVVVDDPRPRPVVAAGPLTPVFEDLTGGDLEALASLVDEVRSSHTSDEAGDDTGGNVDGGGWTGIGALRAGGARAIVVLPLCALDERVGTIILAHSRAVRLHPEDVRPLEVMADHLAAVLAAWAAQERDEVRTYPPGSDRDEEARAELTAARAAARARHPSAAGPAAVTPTLTLVTNLGPQTVPEVPPIDGVDDPGDDPRPPDREGGGQVRPDEPPGKGLFLERRHRRRASSPGG